MADNKDWKIEKTKPEQLEAVMGLYANARRFMAEHGNPNQWGTTFPPVEMIEADIEEGSSYVCVVNGRIAAVFYHRRGFVCGVSDDPDYRRIDDGQWLNDAEYGVVHRITSDGQTKGVASFCLNWALEQCGNIKIDTHRDNVVMQNMLKKNGFSYCGIVYMEDGSERLAYQKSMQKQKSYEQLL